ncbi:MAG: hypothetical protein R2879_00660 [Saprospiraceae bacterium]
MLWFKRLLTSLLLVLSAYSFGHPSWGIVVDDAGMVYFVEPMHNGTGTLWQFNTKTKELKPVFKDFHSHSLTINGLNQLHTAIAIWKTGEIEGEGHNYLFKFFPKTGKLDTLIFTDDWDAFYGGNFEISGDEKKVYFPMDKKLFERDLESGKVKALDFTFKRFCTMTFDDHENLWITDSDYKGGSLLKYDGKEFIEYSTRIFPQKRPNAIFEEQRHQIFYGIGFSENGNPLLTENVENSIWEINPDGSKNTCYTSEKTWYPTGVYFKDGRYYVMEFGFTHQNNGPRLIVLNQNFNEIERFEFGF